MTARAYAASAILGTALLAAVSLASAAEGTPCYNTEKSTAPTSRYVLNGDEVQDKQTGLIWQRCSVGQTYKDGTCTGAIKQMTWDEATRAARGGWRLPTRDELETLVTNSCTAPALNSEVFPGTDVTELSYWTSTASEAGLAWLVYFFGGSDFNGLRGSANSVRLVKGGKEGSKP